MMLSVVKRGEKPQFGVGCLGSGVTPNSVLRTPYQLLFIFLGSVALSIGSFHVLLATWKQLNIDALFADTPVYPGLYQFGIIPMLLFEYCIIGLTAICFAAMVKGGFDKLKSFEDRGLIFWLVCGVIVGMVIGLLFGMFSGLVSGLIVWLASGLIAGLASGLLFGLASGLIFGVSDEFICAVKNRFISKSGKDLHISQRGHRDEKEI